MRNYNAGDRIRKKSDWNIGDSLPGVMALEMFFTLFKNNKNGFTII